MAFESSFSIREPDSARVRLKMTHC
jgi:hypothetical protein